MRRNFRRLALVSLLLIAIRSEAHKPITSKYNYNEDVFPIVDARCGRCHLPGGIAPMSLLTYKDAVPWAESMRLELTANHMPPWYAPGDPHRLTPRELDILLTWATGGTPEGPAKKLSPSPLTAASKLGKPDLALSMPTAFTLGPDTMEDTHDVVLGKPAESDRWIRAVTVTPGTAAVVRDVTVYTKSDGHEKTILWWFPGDDPSVTGTNEAFRWPAGSELRARFHYKKTWTYDGKTVTDRSSVGIYLLKQAPQSEVLNWNSTSESSVLDHEVQILAVRLDGETADKRISISAVRPDGRRLDLIDLLSRPDWNRWYRLPRRLTLPQGTRIETTGDSRVRTSLEVVTAALR